MYCSSCNDHMFDSCKLTCYNGYCRPVVAVSQTDCLQSMASPFERSHTSTATSHAAAVMGDEWTGWGVQVSMDKLAVQESRNESKIG